MKDELTAKQLFYLMGAWNEQHDYGVVKRRCPICHGKLTVIELNLGAYRVVCSTQDCVNEAFRGL